MSIIQAFWVGGPGASPLYVRILSVGGGGGSASECYVPTGSNTPGGAVSCGGGGGGGGVYVHDKILLAGQSYGVTIGAGGNGIGNGSPTFFEGSIAAKGGGHGGSVTKAAQDGGAGGGGYGTYSQRGSGDIPSPTNQGQRGGYGIDGQVNNSNTLIPNTDNINCGGGGGAWPTGYGGAGARFSGPPFGTAGSGGIGYGLPRFIGPSDNYPGSVGFGGGGGSSHGAVGQNGEQTYTVSPAPGTGGGASGYNYENPSPESYSNVGGSGRLIIRYRGLVTKASGGNISTGTAPTNNNNSAPYADYTFHDFTQSGILTVF